MIFHFKNIAFLLVGRTNESKIPTMAGTNHGSDALAKGRALTRFARNSTLNELPNTLAMAIAVTTAIVNCIPGFERATKFVDNDNHNDGNGDWVQDNQYRD